MTLVSAGRVGKAHGYDGSFWVDRASHPLPLGTEVVVGGRAFGIERRAGSDQRPLIRLAGLDDPRRVRGESMLVEQELGEGEWLARDLVGCSVPGLGRVERVIDAPSCSVLELDDGTLVPFIADAVLSVDLDARTISVDRSFLGDA